MSIVLAQDESTQVALVRPMAEILLSYAHLFGVALIVSLIATPLIRRIALRTGVVDQPDFKRKAHAKPVAYLGGIAVFAGIIAAVALSYITTGHIPLHYEPVPVAIIIGLVAITFTGFADDVWAWDPRLKVAGQLVAAAALAIEEVGVKVAAGVVVPVAQMINPDIIAEDMIFQFPLGGTSIPFDLVYWLGTAIIAIFVLGGCNAANLIDGLDGLLSGVTAIVVTGLLLISLVMAVVFAPEISTPEEGTLAGARIVLCVSVLGAVLGFIPYNFNPATIFLGDCGSLLLGYCSVVVILMLGDEGRTYLVCAGLLVFSIPIVDTILAIVRRKLTGISLSQADDLHLHHKLKRALGTVRRAVFALYAFGLALAAAGAGMATLVMRYEQWRARHIFILFLAFYLGVMVVAVWLALRQRRRMRSDAT